MGTVVHPQTKLRAGRRLSRQVSRWWKLDIFFKPEKRYFPCFPLLSMKEHCKEPHHSASFGAAQPHACRKDRASTCSAFVTRKALVNSADLSLLWPGTLMPSLGPCLQLVLIPKGIWLLFLLAWTRRYLNETCNFMDHSPPSDGH